MRMHRPAHTHKRAQPHLIRLVVQADGHDGILAFACASHSHEADIDVGLGQHRAHRRNQPRSISLQHPAQLVSQFPDSLDDVACHFCAAVCHSSGRQRDRCERHLQGNIQTD